MGFLIDASIFSQEYDKNINIILKWLQPSHLNSFIFSYLNINSIRNKSGDLDKIVKYWYFVYSRNEIRFIFSQYIVSSYISIISPYILDIKENKVGLIVFVKSHIRSRRFNYFKLLSNIQIIPFEINIRNKKWLVASIYKIHPRKTDIFSGI